MAEADLGREYLATLRAAQLAVIAMLTRQSERGGRWICTGPELAAIGELLPIHDGQLESTDCTEGFITRIADEIDRRRNAGLFTRIEVTADGMAA